jgi:hypothetical protein
MYTTYTKYKMYIYFLCKVTKAWSSDVCLILETEYIQFMTKLLLL